ncbi:MAG TPA: hypothetical protein VLT32_20075 [Candidatus Sulfomarinibacteraceae bacterium]|nr:hypothetical protein [Candidatus Sulfomarinibacteraceae bacterium]
MKARNLLILGLGALLAASSAVAITPGDDLLIPGAARTNRWHTDLLINNAGATTVSVDVLWLVRDQANPNPESRTFSIGPDDTLILVDVIRNNFGLNSGTGAFRIVSTCGEVTANLIVYAGFNDPVGGTYGSGFEAIPVSAATSAGQSTTLMGLVSAGDFYTNLFALAGASGATMELDLLNPAGNVLDTAVVTLEAYEPWLSFRTDLWDVPTYDNGTLLARVTAGSAVILGSKIDERSQDPTTLETSFGAGAASLDGTYQFAVYDSLGFASGGNLVISGGEVFPLNGTYINFDKLDGQGNSECTLIFLFGIGLAATDVADFGAGVEFTDSYPDSGDMTWTLSFTIEDNLGFEGTIDAVGSSYSGAAEGCNGSFPTLVIEGGKRN